MKRLIEKLERERSLTIEEYAFLLENSTAETDRVLFEKAVTACAAVYGKRVFVRGLIELTNYCKNNCYYCGIRAGNKKAERYRLTEEEILSCCAVGYRTGYRTFVLQGGEDPFFTPEKIENIVRQIKGKYPDCAVTLSLGEQTRETYERWFQAGADRYLLRHETADCDHYSRLHPENLTLENRKKCLFDLKEIGYQVGCGMMVGSPYQTVEHLAKDLKFIEELRPQMVGIGPFLSHKDTPFADFQNGSLETTLRLVAIVRLIDPHLLLPATTALATLCKDGRERGILAGANVCMPNLSPEAVRQKYMLYDNKLSSGLEAAEEFNKLYTRLQTIGYEAVVHRGDYLKKD